MITLIAVGVACLLVGYAVGVYRGFKAGIRYLAAEFEKEVARYVTSQALSTHQVPHAPDSN